MLLDVEGFAPLAQDCAVLDVLLQVLLAECPLEVILNALLRRLCRGSPIIPLGKQRLLAPTILAFLCCWLFFKGNSRAPPVAQVISSIDLKVQLVRKWNHPSDHSVGLLQVGAVHDRCLPRLLHFPQVAAQKYGLAALTGLVKWLCGWVGQNFGFFLGSNFRIRSLSSLERVLLHLCVCF